MNMRRFLALWYVRNRSRFPVPRGNALVDAGQLAYERSLYRLGGVAWYWVKHPGMFVWVQWIKLRIVLGATPKYRIGM